MKKLLAVVLMSILFSSCLSDLRPKSRRSTSAYTAEMRQKGIEILEKYAMVSGQETWDNIQSYQIFLNDDYFGTMGKLAQPFGQKRNQFRIEFYPNENSGSLLLLNGKKKGMVWGYNEGNTYVKETVNGAIKDVENKKIKFWLPTYQYFIELPFRISNADQIYHMGEEKYGLYNYDKVLVTWKQTAPQKKLDQYLIWVNQGTGLVDKLEFTLRDQAGFLKSTAIISEHIVYKGVVIPGLIKVYTREGSRNPLHVMRPHNFTVTSYQ